MKSGYIAILIWVVIALLGAISWCIPEGGLQLGGWTLRWPTLSEVLEIDNGIDSTTNILDTTWIADIVESEAVEEISIDTLAKGIQPLEPKYYLFDSVDLKANNAQEVSTQTFSNSDTRQYLASFYQALDSSSIASIRVVHYGDSQIEEDRITDILRQYLQEKYGGGGVGLLPLHQTIPTRSIRQWITINGVKQSSKEGPKRHLIYGPKSMRQGVDTYGVMVQVAEMDNNLVEGSEDITMYIETIGKKQDAHARFYQLRLVAENIRWQVVTDDSIIECKSDISNLPNYTNSCEIHLQGKGRVYGISLETPTGVLVDNIPMRGCSGTIFTRINSAQLSDYYNQTNTRLIILQYGGNMIPQTNNKTTIDGYVKNLRKQVRYLRNCAPYASILFIGPSDMSTRMDGEMTTYPMVPYLDKALEKMAAEEHIAYWSMYHAMGGKESMVRWVESGLAGSDYVHFTRTGANKIGKKLTEWIEQGMN